MSKLLFSVVMLYTKPALAENHAFIFDKAVSPVGRFVLNPEYPAHWSSHVSRLKSTVLFPYVAPKPAPSLCTAFALARTTSYEIFAEAYTLFTIPSMA